ncbi:two-component system, OmpR family, KDP operon response regulator KdpE [Flavobacterium swingsii]|jgi:two-component system KDP operon response regulator KdpE|uniref:Two-component system, OmpR family, KDP operon response regulator KdpE n=1 Tax=Flavobacterium swingsii TaxID=498292 RepID=A0A1I0WQW8_9FLAO|nr:response regulator [Flavobacterium swingsii]SFA90363.1 two-component system, OmpR family, KDP operon response regulator KdpE [Flavobacterium swingsii]
MNNGFSILVIDDEIQIRKLLEISLEANDYKVLFAIDGKVGITMAASHQPDLILLDLGLPDEDGQEILVKLREWFQNPIIILTVKSAEEEIVKALDHGANDYLTKPFRTQELLARMRTALRGKTSQNKNESIMQFGAVSVDFVSRMVKVKEEVIKLTATEYSLLTLLLKNDGRVLTHQYILKEIWGQSYSEQTQYLRVFVAQLRKKLEEDPNRPKYILTESGVGYRFNSG